MPDDIRIRLATLDDSEAIADIYNHYVLDTTATFDMVPKSPQERATWIAKRSSEHPVLVAEREGAVIAWGSLNPWGSRPGWRHTVEISVYVELMWRNRGLGRRMMEALLERAVDAGHHAVMGQVVSENEQSLRLAMDMGFEQVGLLREVGNKFDRWLDVVLVERVL